MAQVNFNPFLSGNGDAVYQVEFYAGGNTPIYITAPLSDQDLVSVGDMDTIVQAVATALDNITGVSLGDITRTDFSQTTI